jgi:MFS family permease
MTLGYAVGTIVAYITSALFVGASQDSWRIPYFIIGAIFMASLITFGVIVYVARRFAKINNYLDEKYVRAVGSKKVNAMDDNDPLINVRSKRKTIVFYVVDLVMAFLITAVYYCIMNYITSLLVDVYNLPQDVSIYVSILAPITIAVGPMITIRSCDHHKDFIRQAVLFSLILLPIPIIMAFFYNVNIFLALGLSLVFVIFANGVKAIVLSVMAFKMRKVMNAGAYSAISNAVASVSAGVTPTIIGAIIDNYGWQASYFVTFGIVAVTFVLMVIIDVAVRRDYRKLHNMKRSEKID